MSNLPELRKSLAERGISEFEAQNHPLSKEIFERIQKHTADMHAAVRQAIAEAEAPYLKLIEEAENEYSFALWLAA